MKEIRELMDYIAHSPTAFHAIEASKKLHIDFSSIYKACKLGRKAGGYTWEYEDNHWSKEREEK